MSNKMATQGVVKWRTRLTALHEQMIVLQQQGTAKNTTTATGIIDDVGVTNHQQHHNNNNNTNNTNGTTNIGCCIPIVSAPMAGHAGGKLAATVCHANGIGMIGAGHWLSDSMNGSTTSISINNNSKSGLDLLHDEIQLFEEYNQLLAPHQKFPLCIGFIGHSTFAHATTSSSSNSSSHCESGRIDGGGWERLEYVIQTYQPSMIQFFAPAICYRTLPPGQQVYGEQQPQPQPQRGESNIQLIHRCSNNNTKVFVQVGTVAEAMEAVEQNVDGIIVQGSEAGGHGVRREMGSGTLSLVANVIHLVRGTGSPSSSTNDAIPILAAGGIVDGTTMAAVMALGCDGVVIGTRFWASTESIGLSSMKEKLVTTQSCDDIVRTTTFDWIQNTYSKTPWPKPYDSVGAIKNTTYHQWENRSTELASALLLDDNDIRPLYQTACNDGNTDIALVHAGEGIGQIHSIESAYDIVHMIHKDAITAIQNVSRSIVPVQPTTNDSTSDA